MKKLAILILVISALTIGGYIIYKNKTSQKNTPQSTQSNKPGAEIIAEKKVGDMALKTALNVFASAKTHGTDFSNGPCLGIVAPDWVADITHNPRQAVDDLPENQCADFREGRAHHFIELDPDGKLIRTY